MTTNGFSFVPQLIELDKIFAASGEHLCDVFIKTAHMIDEVPQTKPAELSTGEAMVADFLKLDRVGRILFWFRQVNPHPGPVQHFGLLARDLFDAFPHIKMLATPQDLFALDDENALAVGSRIKVVETINHAIHNRRIIDFEQEIIRQEEERKATYEADDQAGMF